MSLLATFLLGVATAPEPELVDQIRAADAAFFAIYFEPRCQADKVRPLITDDFEMYHDKGGVVATSAEMFMADYNKSCVAKALPDGWRSRRELVQSSLRVDPVPGFGAIEDGVHRFYERQGEGPERLAGEARFTQLWQRTPGGWKLKRVFSYAHRGL
ncbi:MAG: hypothetical protein RL339_2075 [Pseudomonadota bacterium]|jgi:hypothetical protein